MNKLYALILLLLGQSICVMQAEQLTELDQVFFQIDFLDRINDESFKALIRTWKGIYSQKYFKLSDDERSKNTDIQDRIISRAQAYHNGRQAVKFYLAKVLSKKGFKPLLQALAKKVPFPDKTPIKASEIAVPLASFTVGFCTEALDLIQGHALLAPYIKRGLYSKLTPKNEILQKSLSVAIKDFKIALTVCALQRAGDLAMQVSGCYDKLNYINKSLFKNFLSKSLCRRFRYAAMPIVHFLLRHIVIDLRHIVYGPDRDYIRYLDQPLDEISGTYSLMPLRII